MKPLRYLTAYPGSLVAEVQGLLENQTLAALLHRKHPGAHDVRTDGALYHYVTALKNEGLRNAPAVNKVVFDSKIHVVNHALGLHTSISRVQGAKLKASHEIRISALFKDAPPAFLSMIAAHELAHLKEKEHNKAFYKLCEHLEPAYHQLELDVRLYLTHLDHGGARLWGPLATG
jgi:predicted metal-dependent hydrolase